MPILEKRILSCHNAIGKNQPGEMTLLEVVRPDMRVCLLLKQLTVGWMERGIVQENQ
jgi:hypothetical protein